MRLRPLLLILLSLTACGGLPQPFAGRPGATALRLTAPPPARLAVPPADAAVLPASQASAFAAALATALVAQDVPAVAEPPQPGDWRLAVTEQSRDGMVVPLYTIDDPAGAGQGSTEGLPIDMAAWRQAAPGTLKQAAADAAPRLASLLTSIEAARHESDPASLAANHTPRVAFHGVTGAPGDGNESLARQMRSELAKAGEVVQDTDAGADFLLAGTVTTTPTAGGQMRVEVQWIIADPQGGERGKVVQLNEIPQGTLDHYWGDVAVVVAHEAAGGVRDVIVKQTGTRP